MLGVGVESCFYEGINEKENVRHTTFIYHIVYHFFNTNRNER